MQQNELISIIKEVQNLKVEKQIWELKAAKGGFPKIFDTLSSFSNQDSGGVIIFGVTDKPFYQIVGVYDAEDVQKKIMECCLQMEPVVRPVITIAEIEGKTVVSAEVPGVEFARRPVYYAGVGITKGSFIRVGHGDRHMTPYEIYSYEAFRKQIRDDLRTVEQANQKLLNTERLEEYIKAVKFERINLSSNVSDDEMLELMGVLKDGKPTLAAILSFSRYPQAYFPQLCITAVAVPGTEIGDMENDARFIDNKRITGSIPEMLEAAVDFVRRNSRTKTIIDEDGNRHDLTEYPMRAIREAILNALVHRDYSIYTEGTPITIEIYRDRIEIQNPGGLYGYASLEDLGKTHPETRNPTLANILELLKITENRYSGIPTMIAEAKRIGIPEPIFEQKRGSFTVIFKNNIFEPDFVSDVRKTRAKGKELKKAIVEFCKIPRSREELIYFSGLSRYQLISKYIQPLIEEGLIAYTLPDTPKSKNQRFVTIE